MELSTNQQAGAFLIAVGNRMLRHNEPMSSALKPSNEREFVASMSKNGVDQFSAATLIPTFTRALISKDRFDVP